MKFSQLPFGLLPLRLVPVRYQRKPKPVQAAPQAAPDTSWWTAALADAFPRQQVPQQERKVGSFF